MRRVALLLLLSYCCFAVGNAVASPLPGCFHATASTGNDAATDSNDCHCDNGAALKAEHVAGKTRSMVPSLVRTKSQLSTNGLLPVHLTGNTKPAGALVYTTASIPRCVLYCIFRL
jgi:hypothetical protein